MSIPCHVSGSLGKSLLQTTPHPSPVEFPIGKSIMPHSGSWREEQYLRPLLARSDRAHRIGWGARYWGVTRGSDPYTLQKTSKNGRTKAAQSCCATWWARNHQCLFLLTHPGAQNGPLSFGIYLFLSPLYGDRIEQNTLIKKCVCVLLSIQKRKTGEELALSQHGCAGAGLAPLYRHIIGLCPGRYHTREDIPQS